MPLPTSRTELLTALRTAAGKLESEFDDIADARIPDVDGVSPADRLAYQIGWGRCLLNWDQSERDGHEPAMPAEGFGWKDLGALAQSFYDEYDTRSIAWLRKTFRATVADVEAMIDRLTDDELFQIGRRDWAGDKWPVVKWIQVNTIAPYRSARTKVRAFKRSLGQS